MERPEHDKLNHGTSMKSLQAIVVGVIMPATICICGAVAGEQSTHRPEYLGLKLAYPTEFVNELPVQNPPYFTGELVVPIKVEISRTGQVNSIEATDSSYKAFAAYLQHQVSGMSFEPGRFDDSPIGCVLPVLAHFRQRSKQAKLLFPVDHNAVVADRDLYFLALTLNDVRPPSVWQFGSFFANPAADDTTGRVPFTLLALKIDSNGRASDVSTVLSTYGAYSMQLESAAQWAQYVPASVRHKRVTVDAFLLIRFFSQISYPTLPYDAGIAGDLPLIGRRQVLVLADTVGLLSKPIRPNIDGERLAVSRAIGGILDSVQVLLSISERGKVSVRRISSGVEKVRSAVRRAADNLKFYPALDYLGNPVPFSGLADFVFSNSTAIRTHFYWLVLQESPLVF
ncbi:MAG: hypothetical protein ACE5FH_03040 [Candidatus Zixiibacteriota bacterium]